MSYQVLYRKYRPKDFSEVVGQDHIVAVIRRQVESGRVAHAYLFSGPRGIGKTTVARIIAKAVNCEHAAIKGAKKPPCNECPSCLAFNAGQAMNLIEIDAASNRGIDEIRELREAVRFAPVSGGTKVYIIDEVHQLTKEAFNALLKTLEEPPSHVVFVLATTELDRVPPTITSRTQHFDFRRPRLDIIGKRLMVIAKREGFTLEPAAADIVAFAAEGSVRDAESMLGKIMAVEDATITEAEVEEILGIPKRAALLQLFNHIGERELKPALELVNRLYHDGYEMEYLLKMMVTFFRDALLAKTDPSFNLASAGSLLPHEGDDLTKRLETYSPSDLANALGGLIDALASVKRTPIPQLPLELALIRIMHSHGSLPPQ